MSVYTTYGKQINEANNIDEALEQCGLNYEVKKKEMFYNNMTINEMGNIVNIHSQVNDYDVLVGDINGLTQTLGIVSKKYKPLQNKEVFSFVDKVDGIKYVSGGISTNGINYIVLAMENDKVSVTLDKDKELTFVPHLVLQNSFNSYNVNGRTGATITYMDNDVAWSLGDNMFNLGFRRTSRTMGKIPQEDMPKTKLNTLNTFFGDTIKSLYSKKVNHIKLSEILDHLYPNNDDMNPNAIIKLEEKKQKFVAMFNDGAETYGKTALNAFRTYFNILNNDKPRKGCDTNFQTLLYPHNNTLKYFMEL